MRLREHIQRRWALIGAGISLGTIGGWGWQPMDNYIRIIFWVAGGLVVLWAIFARHEYDIPTIEKCFERAKLSWGLWWGGGTILDKHIIQEYGKGISRILLLDPSSEYMKYIMEYGNCPAAKVQVLSITKIALEYNIEVRWHTQPIGYSFTIFDSKRKYENGLPKWSRNAWALVKVLEPLVRKDDREMYPIRSKSRAIRFKYVVDTYIKLWESGKIITREELQKIENEM